MNLMSNQPAMVNKSNSIHSLLKGAAVYSVTNVLNALIPFLLLPILTRVLPPADYGVLAMFMAFVGILSALTGLSVHGAINVRFVQRDKIDFPRYVGSCFAILLVSTSLVLILSMLFMKPLAQFTTLPPLWILLAVFYSGCTFVVQVRLGIWMMQKKPLVFGAFQVLQSLCNMGLSLWFVLLLKQGYEGRLWGQMLAVGGFAIIGLLTLYRGGWVVFRPRLNYVREALSFGVPLVPHVFGGFLITLADRFIVNERLGLEFAGIYMVAAQIAMGMGLLAEAFNNAFIPWLYERLAENDEGEKRQIVRGTWVYFVVALAMAGGVALASPWIVKLVAGPGYVEACEALRWLVLGQAFFGMYLMVTNYVFYRRQTRWLAWITLFSGGTGCALTWVLAPRIGISGAGVAFAIAMGVRFFLTWILAQKVFPMPWGCFAKGVLPLR